MDPITIAMGLSQFVPQIVKWISGSDKAAQVAQKAVDIAKTVTGQPDGDGALKALQADPNLVLKYREAVLDQELDFEKLAVANAADINKTMQAEAASDHWPTYSWRPFIGFCFGLMALIAGGTSAVCYIGVMFFHVDGKVLAELPALVGSEAAVMATMAPVLGVASWFRGKMQANPNLPTDNRG